MAEKAMQWLLCRIYGDKKGRSLTQALLKNETVKAFIDRADDNIERELTNLIIGRMPVTSVLIGRDEDKPT